jgi:hypothetical protein
MRGVSRPAKRANAQVALHISARTFKTFKTRVSANARPARPRPACQPWPRRRFAPWTRTSPTSPRPPSSRPRSARPLPSSPLPSLHATRSYERLTSAPPDADSRPSAWPRSRTPSRCSSTTRSALCSFLSSTMRSACPTHAARRCARLTAHARPGQIWQMYKKAVASFWTVEEVDLSKDQVRLRAPPSHTRPLTPGPAVSV